MKNVLLFLFFFKRKIHFDIEDIQRLCVFNKKNKNKNKCVHFQNKNSLGFVNPPFENKSSLKISKKKNLKNKNPNHIQKSKSLNYVDFDPLPKGT